MKLQGAIYLLSNSCWGKDRLRHMSQYFPVAVTAVVRCTAVWDPEVMYEVLLTSKKLIKTFGNILHNEWDGALQVHSNAIYF